MEVDLETFCKSNKSSNYINFLIDKFNRVQNRENISRVNNSKSLWFSNSLKYDLAQPGYFNLIRNIDFLRVVYQLRLYNKYNERIIIKKKLFKCKVCDYCFCCCTKNVIPHILNECILYNDIRKKYFQEEYPILLNYIESVDASKVKILIECCAEILDRYNKY